MVHRVKGALANAPMGVCVVSQVSIFVRNREDNILSCTLAEVDGVTDGGVIVSEAGMWDGIDRGVVVIRGHRNRGCGARFGGGGQGGKRNAPPGGVGSTGVSARGGGVVEDLLRVFRVDRAVNSAIRALLVASEVRK